MGPEEVLIQGGSVSVDGQVVPEGESRLLHGESNSLPSALLAPLGQLPSN